jgi:hypothetical protein
MSVFLLMMCKFHDVGVAGYNGFVEGIGKVQTLASMMAEIHMT